MSDSGVGLGMLDQSDCESEYELEMSNERYTESILEEVLAPGLSEPVEQADLGEDSSLSRFNPIGEAQSPENHRLTSTGKKNL